MMGVSTLLIMKNLWETILIRSINNLVYISATTSEKSRKVHGSKKPLEGPYILSEFDEGTGQVLGTNSKKIVAHYGYLVRDRLLVSAREWRQRKDNPNISFVSDRDKELIWLDILQHFTLDTQDEALKEKVKIWAMQKMAKQFQAWKKTLYKTFVAQG